MMRMVRVTTAFVLLVLLAGTAWAGILFAPSYSEVISFPDGLPQTGNFHVAGLAHDGSYYWSASGGLSTGLRLAQHDGRTGAVLETYAPRMDFRSIFTDTAGLLYARLYRWRTIYVSTSPGVFNTSVVLNDGALHEQSSVTIWGDVDYEYVAQKGNLVSRWDEAGNFIGTVELLGYGSVPGENEHPADERLVAAGDYWLTYCHGVLSAWDVSGNRIDQTTLIGAGTEFDSHFSLSYANGMVFVNDGDTVGMWRGYDVGQIPEAATLLLLGLGGLMLRERRRA